MKASTRQLSIARTIRWIARVLSGILALFNGAYILLAILMITAAGEELFPKMTFSFLALIFLSIAIVAAWRWETLGTFAMVAALLAYQMAERSRLGHGPRSYWYIAVTASIAALFLASSALHWWIRKHSSEESSPVRPP